MRKAKAASTLKQMMILMQRQLNILFSNKRKLVMILVLPILTAMVVSFVAGKNLFITYDSTKSTLFTMVCVGVWIGLFNSIQEICQEREILKREYMANLKLHSYILSKISVQAILCFVQTLVFLLICNIRMDLFNNPSTGLIGSPFFDYFVSMFLIMLSSDALGLLVSSLVKSGDLANIISPIILILQLVLSGVLFSLSGFSKNVAYLMVSKWGMEALGSIADLNSLELSTIHRAKNPETKAMLETILKRKPEDIYEAVPAHLWKTWIIMLFFIVLFCVLSTFILRRISKDSR